MPQPVNKPHVVFSTDAVAYVDAEGHTQYKDVIMATISQRGSTDSQYKVASEWINDLKFKSANRGGFDENALMYADWYDHFSNALTLYEKGQEMPLDGTSLKLFKTFTPAQLKTCENLGVRTLEELATVNEQFIQRCGVGGRALKDKATAILDANKNVPVGEENSALKLQVEELTAQVKTLSNKLEAAMADKKKKELQAA